MPTPSAHARDFVVFRIAWIRGVCMLGVVLIHVAAVISLTGQVNWLTPVLLFAVSVARFAVPIFFTVSGFQLSLNTRNEKPWPLYRRALPSLLIPYVAYSTLYWAVTYRSHPVSWEGWLWALATGTAYGTLWFIPVIVQFYLLHPFLRKWFRRAERPVTLLILAFLVQIGSGICAEVAIHRQSTNAVLDVAGVWVSSLQYLGYFVSGYLLLDYAAKVPGVLDRRLLRPAAGATWLLAAVALTAWCAIPLHRSGTWSAIPHLSLAIKLASIPMSASALLLLLAWSPGARLPLRVNLLIKVYGLYAFGIYFLHPAVLLVVSAVLTKFVGLSWTGPTFYVLSLPLVWGLSAVAVKVLVRLPFTRYLT